MSIKPFKELVERHKILQYIHLDLNYKYIENKSTTQNKSAEHSFFYLFLYRKNRLCLKIHTISSMFLFVFFSLINYLSDNIENAEYANVGKEDGYGIRRAIRPETQACNAESEQEDSNLIMPFLVQNEKVIKGLTTLKILRRRSYL